MAVFYYPDSVPSSPCAAIATVGMFDGVHSGHRHIVAALKAEGEDRGLRSVVVTFDRHPRSVLGRAGDGFGLLCTLDERLQILQRLGDIDIVVLPFTEQFARLSACRFLSQVLCEGLNAKALLLGYDNQFGSRTDNDFDQLPAVADAMGVVLLHDSPVMVDGAAVSSTRVRKALAAGNVRLASVLLGYDYRLTGTVEQGRHVGSRLGIPTANISPDEQRMIPQEGVYAVRVEIDDKEWRGVSNVGTSPTFGVTKSLIETHIIGFDGDLYGSRLSIDFVERLRDTRHFDSVEALRQAMLGDIEKAKGVLG
ncbi:MAG: riboflavin biosynthesis protein RibF [Bacteroidales bacterium]|nr:riboflavin biosynthesis protein RibF [Bacteroidales bacterium]